MFPQFLRVRVLSVVTHHLYRAYAMDPTFHFPPDTAEALRVVCLRVPTFSSSRPITTSTHRLRLYRNLAQFVGRSHFGYRPSFFQELFTHTSTYSAPVIEEKAVQLYVKTQGDIHRHDVTNECGLRQLVTNYLMAIANLIVTRAQMVAISSGDDDAAQVLRRRSWLAATDMPPRNTVLLRQNTPVDASADAPLHNVAAGVVKTHQAIDDYCFDIIVSIFRIRAISIDAVRNYGPAVCIDWDRVFEEHPQEWLDHHHLARHQKGRLAEWQERLTAAIQETIGTLVQDQVDISFLTTYQRWIVMRLIPQTDGSVTIALSPIIYDNGTLTSARPWDHPMGLLACLGLLRPSRMRGVRPYNDVSASRAYLFAKSAMSTTKCPVITTKYSLPLLSHPSGSILDPAQQGLYCSRTRYTKNGVRCHCPHDPMRARQIIGASSVSERPRMRQMRY